MRPHEEVGGIGLTEGPEQEAVDRRRRFASQPRVSRLLLEKLAVEGDGDRPLAGILCGAASREEQRVGRHRMGVEPAGHRSESLRGTAFFDARAEHPQHGCFVLRLGLLKGSHLVIER